MSLDKAIKHGKEKRKGWRERGKSGEVDPTCRPHGGGYSYPCPYCAENRMVRNRRLSQWADEQEREIDENRS